MPFCIVHMSHFQIYRLMLIQAMKTHSNTHIKELLAWEQLADVLKPETMRAADNEDDDRLPSHSTYVSNPDAACDDSAPKELNLDRWGT